MSFDPYSAASQPGPGAGYPSKPSGQDQLPMVLAVLSVITGIMGFGSCLCCLFMPLPVLSLATGIPVLVMRASDSNAKIIAIVGVACAALSLVTFVVALALGFASAALDPNVMQEFNR